MAINVSIQDRGADYISRGFEALGQGIENRRENKRGAAEMLARSSDPASAAVGGAMVRDFAGISPEIESRYLTDEIDALASAGFLSPEESRKAHEGNLSKKRQAISQASVAKDLSERQRELILNDSFRQAAEDREMASYEEKALMKARAEAKAMLITGDAEAQLQAKEVTRKIDMELENLDRLTELSRKKAESERSIKADLDRRFLPQDIEREKALAEAKKEPAKDPSSQFYTDPTSGATIYTGPGKVVPRSSLPKDESSDIVKVLGGQGRNGKPSPVGSWLENKGLTTKK